MKKLYAVEAVRVTPAMIRGEEPWSDISMVLACGEEVEADSADEAVDLVKNYLEYECDSHAEPYGESDDIYVWRDEDGKIVEGLAFFKANRIDIFSECADWGEVWESMSEQEKAEARRAYDEEVSDEKIIADVKAYFADFVGESTENCFGDDVPDVQDDLPAYTARNFLWALS